MNQLESLLTSSARVPATRRGIVELDKLVDLVSRMRAAVPQDVHDAEELMRDRENILDQAQAEAQRIRQVAEEEARRLVMESAIAKEASRQAEEVVAEAQRRAQHILDEAEADAAARRNGADQYAQEVLHKLEQEVAELLVTVRRGIDVLGLQRDVAR